MHHLKFSVMKGNIKDIQQSYQSPHEIGSFSGINSFVTNKIYKDQNAVQRALKSLDSYTKFKPARKNFKRQRVIVRYPREL